MYELMFDNDRRLRSYPNYKGMYKVISTFTARQHSAQAAQHVTSNGHGSIGVPVQLITTLVHIETT